MRADSDARCARALHVLRETFGDDTSRGSLADIVDHVVAPGHALVLIPAGGGKSLCLVARTQALVKCASAAPSLSRCKASRPGCKRYGV